MRSRFHGLGMVASLLLVLFMGLAAFDTASQSGTPKTAEASPLMTNAPEAVQLTNLSYSVLPTGLTEWQPFSAPAGFNTLLYDGEMAQGLPVVMVYMMTSVQRIQHWGGTWWALRGTQDRIWQLADAFANSHRDRICQQAETCQQVIVMTYRNSFGDLNGNLYPFKVPAAQPAPGPQNTPPPVPAPQPTAAPSGVSWPTNAHEANVLFCPTNCQLAENKWQPVQYGWAYPEGGTFWVPAGVKYEGSDNGTHVSLSNFLTDGKLVSLSGGITIFVNPNSDFRYQPQN